MTAEEFAIALVGNNSIANVLVFHGNLEIIKKKPSWNKRQIDNISKLKDFEFVEQWGMPGLLARQHSGIGESEFIHDLPAEDEMPKANYNCQVVVKNNQGDIDFIPVDDNIEVLHLKPAKHHHTKLHVLGSIEVKEVKEINACDDEEDEMPHEARSTLFECPTEGCDGKFRLSANLKRHLQDGQCYVNIKKLNERR